MKLYLKNVGRIKEAELLIDGLTVICGENNTGKSTIGKVLYYDMNDGLPRSSYSYAHRPDLLRTLCKERDYRTTTVEDILQDKKIKEIERKFDEISSGNIVYHDGKYEYKSPKLRENMDLVSLSTGIKSFAILRKLLKDGKIEENGILVIDEPEVHLHPAWQMKYAEILVMLQKEYGLNIIIATHSFDFLNALMYYSKLYEIEKSCNCYLAEEDSMDDSGFPDVCFAKVNNGGERIYASLSAPFLDLYAKDEFAHFVLPTS
ncbi:MAG: AAA family ATPase [Lachnospiraceae bacterium]|nr:AAA family ATPase [Lachnospiraceae bacterium]